MRVFECIAAGGTYVSTPVIQANRDALWCAAFQVDSLDGLFDMTPADHAIPVFDAAIARFNDAPESLRPLVAADDPIGLRGNRKALIGIRTFLAHNGGTISGAVEQEEVMQ
ncbi:hypothetical protein [Nocardia niwae]|uniref:hypothetical protein n=1 Tax=Nocardia niwae TaxID=626084 RepID=UPI000A624C8A|nr:hypothetical protein [Nocardia niwae]